MIDSTSAEITRFHMNARTLRSLMTLAFFGAGVATIGLFIAPERIWPSLLLAVYYVLSIGLAASVFIAFVYLSNAGWATVLRRIPEAISYNLGVFGLFMLLLLFGIHHLYEWSHDSVSADVVLQSKSPWLNIPFFSARTLIYLVLWIGGTWLMVRTSRLQDSNGDLLLTARNKRYAGIFTVIFTLTFWVASMDWIMSLEPHWYSTIFGIYNFSGLFLNGIAAISIVVIILRRTGFLREFVREEHLHDLGKLLFAFSTFWMYIWFSQYLLIWYANIPEETVYFIRRENAGWGTFTILNLLFNWVLPFSILLSKAAKKNEGLLLKVCVIVMIGRWIDLSWMINPPFHPSAPVFGIWEIGPLAGAIALFFLVTFYALGKANIIPVKDPMLVESLHYHS